MQVEAMGSHQGGQKLCVDLVGLDILRLLESFFFLPDLSWAPHLALPQGHAEEWWVFCRKLPWVGWEKDAGQAVGVMIKS